MHYSKLATNSLDIVTGSCTYGNLNTFINLCFMDDEQILQRIADSNLQKKQAKEIADAEAAKKEADLAKIEDAKMAEGMAADLDDFDCFGGDYGDEVAAPAKAAPAKPVAAAAPKKEAEPAAA